MHKIIQKRKSNNKIPFWKEIFDSQKKHNHGEIGKNIVPVKFTNDNHYSYHNFGSWRIMRK